jgi:hypothetical protein
MLLGLSAWVLAMTLLALGWPLGLVVGSLTLNGVYVATFLVAGQIYLNTRADDGMRASVQGLFSCVNGMGLLLGHLSAGWLRRQAGGELSLTFAVGAALTATLLVIFLLGFRPPRRQGRCRAERTHKIMEDRIIRGGKGNWILLWSVL